MRIGYKLMAESFGPAELVRQAVRAESAGFDFVEISDHYHPWLEEQGHSPFAWTVLGAIAERTGRIGLATGVTCPTVRYHPAVIAQAAATLALLSDGRFTLGLGSGERLNEHVTEGFPESVRVRHDLLGEAVAIIRLLWTGGYHSYEGKHLRLRDARVFDLPGTPPPIALAAGGPRAAALAAELGDALFATEDDPELVRVYRDTGGTGPCYAEVPLAWAADPSAAAHAAHRSFRWSVHGWKVLTELPGPAAFDAACTTVGEDDMLQAFACGPDVGVHLERAQRYVDAGFDTLALLNAGPDPDGFLDFYQRELDGPIRGLTASADRP
ncbi:TIGR03557 family F420-dependent LLM class oxidoreductase [Streptomyces uncialis]|uniref:TIGR03557 family F420-dependent LLM class oxidoreductase n=1 Tax=Streptomyces uncialis TaxID=1048205 RepID=UPI002E3068BE|nr:TIGR03557 family F420-dependent LLM class oxidoreductase [Streptomyces uncialis]